MNEVILKKNNLRPSSDLPSRKINSITGATDGPTVIILGGIHGNEPQGVAAAEQLFKVLQNDNQPFWGRIVALRANRRALQYAVRYVDEDMNRIWFPSIIEKIRSTPPGELKSSERREIKELLGVLDHEIPDDSEYPTIIADLHSFSAEGHMFAITAPRKKHTDLLSSVHLPMVFGIEKTLRGTALRYYQDQGHITFALEGGQHQNELTSYNQTAALMLILEHIGCIPEKRMSRIPEFRNHLIEHSKNLPEQVELIYQHFIEEGDSFAMRTGYHNFQHIKKGEWLASDQKGKIYAECDGYLIMPLYQQQGNDGFFVVQPKG